jgi:membrane protein DedA with SNARE-associated domain
MVPATLALDYTLALIAIFGGIGVVVNGIIVYIVAQTMGERRANQEWRERGVRPEEEV